MRRLCVTGLCAALVATLLGAFLVAAIPYGRTHLERWTRSEGFQEMLSREVSKSMKLDGRFAPITVHGIEARTESYTGTGWPGEAIASLDAEGIHAVFNPWAIFRRIWQVDRISIERGTFRLRMPDDALKRPSVVGKKPWHAIFLPTRFYCPQIICPDARVEFPFQGRIGVLENLNLRARMIGRDFEYRADSGRVRFPLLPEMRVEDLNLFISREQVDIRSARLGGVDGDPGNTRITARLGMREDRSIQARVELERLPFGKALPPEWFERLEGRLTGKLEWNTDSSGLKTASDGVVRVEDVEIHGWAWLENLARLHHNPELKTLRVPQASCRFSFDGSTFRIRDLEADAGTLAALRGVVDYTGGTGEMRADLILDRFDVDRWLPSDFKQRTEARGSGSIFWQGSWKEPLQSTAAGRIHIPACSYRYRTAFLRGLERYGVHLPAELSLEGIDVHFSQNGSRFDVSHFGLRAGDGLELEAYGHWLANRSWDLNLDLRGLDAALWKPKGGRGRVAGRVELRGHWQSETARLEDGRGDAVIRVDGARLSAFGFQNTLARFLKRPGVRDLRFRDFTWRTRGDLDTLHLEEIRMFAPGQIGVEGGLQITADGRLSGTVWVGLPAAWLSWLPEAETAVFTRKKDGLCWAQVRLRGTTERMEEDLSQQILRVLRRHPTALFGLGMRAASWWLGDVLGTYREP